MQKKWEMYESGSPFEGWEGNQYYDLNCTLSLSDLLKISET